MVNKWLMKILAVTAALLMILLACGKSPLGLSDSPERTYYYRSAGVGTVVLDFFRLESEELVHYLLELKEFSFPNARPSNANEILPLAVGNRWVYDVTVSDSLGEIQFQFVDSNAVDRDTLINGERWYIIMRGNTNLGLGANRMDGYWARNLPPWDSLTISDVGPAYLAAKFPAALGETFLNIDNLITKVLSTDTTVEVPAGSFSCYKYLRTTQR